MGKIRGRKRLMQWIDRRETVIRAALTHDTYSAERAAKSNNVQIITMGAWVIGPEVAKSIVDTWLASKFDPAGPSAGNVMVIDKLDSGKLATL